MKRRQFLSAAALLALAGCASDEPDIEGVGTPSPTTERPEDTTADRTAATTIPETTVETATATTVTSPPTTTEPTTTVTSPPTTTEPTTTVTSPPTTTEPTTTVQRAADATVVESGSATTELYNRDTIGATGVIENTGGVRLAYTSATAKFYNADGELLNTRLDGIRDLKPGERWRVWLPYTGEVQKVNEVSLEVTDTLPRGRTINPSGFSVESSEFTIPQDQPATPRMSGAVKNTTDEPGYLHGLGKVFDADSRVLATGIDSISELGPGETWRFEIRIASPNPFLREEIADHTVVLAQ
jgi:hypothetical protein